MKNLFKVINADIIACTSFVFLLLWAVSQIDINTDIIDPIGEALSDFDETDLVYTALRDEPAPDTNITLVNIGNLDRAGVAQLIENLNANQPSVIAIDARFFKDKTQYYRENGLINADSLLEIAFSKTQNLVLATKLDELDTTTGHWTQLGVPLPRFRQYSHDGFVNVITKENEFRVAKKVTPVEFLNDSVQIFFPVKIAQLHRPEKAEKFMQRKKVQKFIEIKKAKDVEQSTEKYLETIYYRGNINNFFGETDEFGRGNAFNVIDVDEALFNTYPPNLVQNKICILGYMGETVKNNKYWDEDKFYTPLNKNFAGKSFPDMYGVVVHANIVSMILNETYVDVVEPDVMFYINIAICIFAVILFAYIHHYHNLWWDGVSVICAFTMAGTLMFITLVSFENYRLELDFTYTYVFLIVLGNFLELYYEYAKPGLLWVWKHAKSLVLVSVR